MIISDRGSASHRPWMPIAFGSRIKHGMIKIQLRKSVKNVDGLYSSMLCRKPISTTLSVNGRHVSKKNGTPTSPIAFAGEDLTLLSESYPAPSG